MTYDRKDYYAEGLAESFSDHGIVATPEQIAAVAADVVGYADNIGMAFYTPPARDHYEPQIEQLRRELNAERDKIHCRTCDGRGRIIENFGPWHSNTHCDKCGGKGRHAP